MAGDRFTSDRGGSQASTDGALLERAPDRLSARAARHCPRCGRSIRAGQRVTVIFGTRVHVGCSGARPPS
ncbi:MAG: hypothetical protein ACR2LK_09160 [Solirubrobacteraceae bacterium]